ncbi:10513_t:CDS:1, partial [Funneliformis caledonium]
ISLADSLNKMDFDKDVEDKKNGIEENEEENKDDNKDEEEIDTE